MTRAALIVVASLLVGCGDDAPTTPTTPTADAPAAQPAGVRGTAAAGFAGEDFAPAAEAGATYRRAGEYLEPVMLISGVPTYDDGMALKADTTPLSRWRFTYTRVADGSLAMTADGIAMTNDPTQWQLDGPFVRYDPAGNPTAKGTYDSNRLQGTLTRFDPAGNVTATETYDAGVRAEPDRFAAEVYEPLVGEWLDESMQDGRIVRLVNVMRADGTMTISSQRFGTPLREGADPYPLGDARVSDNLAWRYVPADNPLELGTFEVYDGNQLLGRTKLTELTDDTFKSRQVYHRSPAAVGQTYDFKRVRP